jgi:hypothetical protein
MSSMLKSRKGGGEKFQKTGLKPSQAPFRTVSPVIWSLTALFAKRLECSQPLDSIQVTGIYKVIRPPLGREANPHKHNHLNPHGITGQPDDHNAQAQKYELSELF